MSNKIYDQGMNGKNLEKLNTVSSSRQTQEHIFWAGRRDGSPRIMFVGNSITFHGPKEEIGWSGAWGMAASAREKDYVHLVMKIVQNQHPDAAFCIVQAAEWERTYTEADYDRLFGEAVNFAPDVICCCISANIPAEKFEKVAFKKNLKKLHRYLCRGNANTKIIQTSSFFDNEEKNIAIKEYTEEEGARFVYISDIIRDKENLAFDSFDHKGIQMHPGDKGMEILAERICKALTVVLA